MPAVPAVRRATNYQPVYLIKARDRPTFIMVKFGNGFTEGERGKAAAAVGESKIFVVWCG